jgi:metal-sulfur cluster biosynthetic enzyme
MPAIARLPVIREAAVGEAIATVLDPCSIAAQAPLNIVELGLVREWNVDDEGAVSVTVTPTAPSCILIGSIVKGIEDRVLEVDGVTAIEVELDGATIWSEELMSPAARTKLKQRQEGSMEQVPVRPREWEAAKGG